MPIISVEQQVRRHAHFGGAELAITDVALASVCLGFVFWSWGFGGAKKQRPHAFTKSSSLAVLPARLCLLRWLSVLEKKFMGN